MNTINDDYTKPDYLLPTLRNGVAMTQFIGAIRTRIASRQKALWSRFIGAGFIAEDIKAVYPEQNMRFFSIKHSGIDRYYNIEDLNLRELDELLKWLTLTFPYFADPNHDHFSKEPKI